MRLFVALRYLVIIVNIGVWLSYIHKKYLGQIFETVLLINSMILNSYIQTVCKKRTIPREYFKIIRNHSKTVYMSVYPQIYKDSRKHLIFTGSKIRKHLLSHLTKKTT